MKLSGCLVTSDHQKVFYDQYKFDHKKVIIIDHGFFNSKQAILLKQLGESLNNEYDCILLYPSDQSIYESFQYCGKILHYYKNS